MIISSEVQKKGAYRPRGRISIKGKQWENENRRQRLWQKEMF